MESNFNEMMYRMNCLAADLDSLYHQAAKKLGVSDSVMIVLYFLYENNGIALLNDIRKTTGISKQTLNSALRKLENERIVSLEQKNGREKLVYLTSQGKEYAKQTAAKLFNAECRVFEGWTLDEIQQYLYFMEKFNHDFRQQIEKL